MKRRPFRESIPELKVVRTRFSYDPETGVLRLARARQSCYRGKVAGTIGNTGYRIVNIGRVRYPAHRIAYYHYHGEWPPEYIDHKNGDRDDNRIENLRLASQSLNNANSERRKDNSTGHKGVSFDRSRGLFRAYIVSGGRQQHLGRFIEFEAACAAYRAAAQSVFGDFARPS